MPTVLIYTLKKSKKTNQAGLSEVFSFIVVSVNK